MEQGLKTRSGGGKLAGLGGIHVDGFLRWSGEEDQVQ